MFTLKRILGLFVILASVMALCGAAALTQGVMQELPTETPTDTALPPEPPTDTAVPTDTLTNTPLPTDTPTETPTPTFTLVPTMPGPPMLSVSAATNCRTGPSANYSVVYILRPGITVMVVGKDLPDNYWIIAVPGFPGTVCWLWGQYALVTGDIDSLPSPATPQPSPYTLDEPKNLSASCSSVPSPNDDEASTWTVVLHWQNTEPNQAGVRIYRFGRQIATLHGFPRSFTNTFSHYDWHPGVRYGIQAYNGSAVSSIVWISIRSCHD